MVDPLAAPAEDLGMTLPLVTAAAPARAIVTRPASLAALVVGGHYVARLRGFPSAELRVRVERVDIDADCVWIRTADLLDAGTALVVGMAAIVLGPLPA